MTTRPCTHRRTHHAHGDLMRYVKDHCRCAPCTDAKRRYNNALKLRHIEGREPLVPVDECQTHIRSLLASGLYATARLVRAPSVDDYARMTSRARLAAVRLLEEQMRHIERRRLALTPVVPVKHADDIDPADTIEAAKFMLVTYQRRYQETPELKARRLALAHREASAWVDSRRQRRGVAA